LPGPVVAISLGSVVRAVGVLVAPLFISAITIHGEVECCSLKGWRDVVTKLVHPGVSDTFGSLHRPFYL
jgi:hypothetical protein